MSRVPFTPDQYRELVAKLTPPSRMLRGYWRAFWVGGLICAIGQALGGLYRSLWDKQQLEKQLREEHPADESFGKGGGMR